MASSQKEGRRPNVIVEEDNDDLVSSGSSSMDTAPHSPSVVIPASSSAAPSSSASSSHSTSNSNRTNGADGNISPSRTSLDGGSSGSSGSGGIGGTTSFGVGSLEEGSSWAQSLSSSWPRFAAPISVPAFSVPDLEDGATVLKASANLYGTSPTASEKSFSLEAAHRAGAAAPPRTGAARRSSVSYGTQDLSLSSSTAAPISWGNDSNTGSDGGAPSTNPWGPNNNNNNNSNNNNTTSTNTHQSPPLVHSGINWSATSSPFNQPLKVIIVGSPSSGKTAWATGAWSFGIGDSKQTEDRSSNAASALKNYTPTTVASLFEPAIFKTTRGRDVVFKLWDLPGASEFQPHADGYFVGADAALIFFDTTSKTSYQDVAIWYREVVRVCGLTLPIALVRTKVDDSEHMELKPRHISFHRKKGIPLIDVSTKLSFQILKPLVWIARRIAGDEELRFAQDPLPQAFPDRENLLLSETSSLSSVSALGVSSAPSVATSTSSSLNAHLASGLSISLSAPSTPPLGSRTDSLSPANSDARPSSSSTTDVLATGVDAVSLQN